MEKRTLSPEEVAQLGVVTNHEQMPSGEYRLWLMDTDGSGYIRTVAGEFGAWQNSHYHKGIREFYAVQKGWIAFVEWGDELGSLNLRVLREGETVMSKPGQPHNVYVPAGTVIHTVKFGDTAGEKASGQADWHASPELDKSTKLLFEEVIISLFAG